MLEEAGAASKAHRRLHASGIRLVMRFLIDFIMYIELKAFALGPVHKKHFVHKKRNFKRPCYCY